MWFRYFKSNLLVSTWCILAGSCLNIRKNFNWVDHSKSSNVEEHSSDLGKHTPCTGWVTKDKKQTINGDTASLPYYPAGHQCPSRWVEVFHSHPSILRLAAPPGELPSPVMLVWLSPQRSVIECHWDRPEKKVQALVNEKIQAMHIIVKHKQISDEAWSWIQVHFFLKRQERIVILRSYPNRIGARALPGDCHVHTVSLLVLSWRGFSPI